MTAYRPKPLAEVGLRPISATNDQERPLNRPTVGGIDLRSPLRQLINAGRFTKLRARPEGDQGC